MPAELDGFAKLIIQAGATGALLLLLWALKSGWLRTGQEVESLKAACRQEVEAWRGRSERAEKQVDTLLPAMEKLTDAIFNSTRTSAP